ncbi:MAG: SRPBCC family protein [Pseudomonadota bacterium]
MVRVKRSTILDHSTDTVWSVLRDFNGHDHWHPAVATSQIERSRDSDRIGCIRKFRLTDGSELREQLLALSDVEQSFSYCLLDTPIPLFNYVAHVRLFPVTDSDRTFWEWEGTFNTIDNREDELRTLVGEEIYQAGFHALRSHLGDNL